MLFLKTMAKLRSILVGFLFVHALGCASADSNYESTMMIPDLDGNSTAPGAAFSSMMVRKPIPTRPNWKPVDFYYKHCTSMDSKSYFSKTAYDCASP